MKQKFQIGESVRLTLIYYGCEYKYEGMIRSYYADDQMYWIDLGIPTGHPLTSHIPAGLINRLSVQPMNGTWHVYRGNRGLEALVYSDGLENWV